MRNLGYNLVKIWIKASLHLYFGKIKMVGLENVPKDTPVLFLPNHQSALIDVLLIAVDCNRKPWFLTRSDVFKKNLLIKIFNYFQMIPIYRIRDGREALKNNQAVFDRCSQLLCDKEALLMFPEANHNLKRRVRPLSKGFTRILFNTLNQAPDTDIHIVPVGLNYKDAVTFPDKVALFFGEAIAVKELYDATDLKESTNRVKEKVASELKTLTTHIEDEAVYEQTVARLDALGVDYLNPKAVNATLQNLTTTTVKETTKKGGFIAKLMAAIFFVLNMPVLLLWRNYFKAKVWEAEFMGSLRFAYAVLIYPLYYGSLFLVFSWAINPTIGFVAILGLFLFNWGYVKSR